MQIPEEMVLEPNLAFYTNLCKQDGAQFISNDATGRPMTVTGAVWTPRGRQFDGVDDIITTPAVTTLQGMTQLTVCASLTTVMKAGVNWQEAASMGYWNGNGWRIAQDDGTHTVSIYFRNASGAQNIAITFADGEWINLCVTWDGATMYGYKNGVFVGSAVLGAGAISPTDPLYIGRRSDAASQYWAGTMAELKVLNKFAFPAQAANAYGLSRQRMPWLNLARSA